MFYIPSAANLVPLSFYAINIVCVCVYNISINSLVIDDCRDEEWGYDSVAVS